MARKPDRATLEIGAQRDLENKKWYFVVFGAHRRLMHQSESIYDTEHEARAAARDWLTQTMLR